MGRRVSAAALILGLALTFVAGCGEKKEAEPETKSGTAAYLGEEIAGAERNSSVDTYVGESLYKYIDGGAELYHAYGFVEVSTASYQGKSGEFVLDLYQFKDPVSAYGLYSMVRPDGATTLPLGVEGFATGTTLDFVKGAFLVRFTAFEETPGLSEELLKHGHAMEAAIPGTTNIPATFALFPVEDRLPATEKIFAESFLGRQPLSNVYTVEYLNGDDTLTLFFTDDISHEKFTRWQSELADADVTKEVPASLSFDEGLGFVTEDSYYGRIVAGLKAGRLAGAVGAELTSDDFISSWINSLAQ